MEAIITEGSQWTVGGMRSRDADGKSLGYYNSLMQKSVRRGLYPCAMHAAMKMLSACYGPTRNTGPMTNCLNRLIIYTIEDVGPADPWLIETVRHVLQPFLDVKKLPNDACIEAVTQAVYILVHSKKSRAMSWLRCIFDIEGPTPDTDTGPYAFLGPLVSRQTPVDWRPEDSHLSGWLGQKDRRQKGEWRYGWMLLACRQRGLFGTQSDVRYQKVDVPNTNEILNLKIPNELCDIASDGHVRGGKQNTENILKFAIHGCVISNEDITFPCHVVMYNSYVAHKIRIANEPQLLKTKVESKPKKVKLSPTDDDILHNVTSDLLGFKTPVFISNGSFVKYERPGRMDYHLACNIARQKLTLPAVPVQIRRDVVPDPDLLIHFENDKYHDKVQTCFKKMLKESSVVDVAVCGIIKNATKMCDVKEFSDDMLVQLWKTLVFRRMVRCTDTNSSNIVTDGELVYSVDENAPNDKQLEKMKEINTVFTAQKNGSFKKSVLVHMKKVIGNRTNELSIFASRLRAICQSEEILKRYFDDDFCVQMEKGHFVSCLGV